MENDFSPDNLPPPQDDGAWDHLWGLTMPDVALPSTAGELVSLAAIVQERTVLYCYPMTGRPDRDLPDDWEVIPGARGCTPQSCAFRDHHTELAGALASALRAAEQRRVHLC